MQEYLICWKGSRDVEDSYSTETEGDALVAVRGYLSIELVKEIKRQISEGDDGDPKIKMYTLSIS